MRNYCSRLFIFVAFVMTAWSGYGQGIKPGDVFQHSPIDSVDLKDLNSVIHIPLFSLPQRGTTKAMTFSISANTQIWSAWQECNDLECDYQYQASQPRYPSPDIFPNPSVGPWLVTDPQFGRTGDREIYPHDDSCGYYDEGICVPTHTNEYAINELFYFVDSTGARHKALYDTYDHTHLRTVDGSGYMVKYPNGSQPYNAYAAYLHVLAEAAVRLRMIGSTQTLILTTIRSPKQRHRGSIPWGERLPSLPYLQTCRDVPRCRQERRRLTTVCRCISQASPSHF